MMDQEYPQVYLITPGDFELARFGDQLGSVLDGNEVACVRLALTTKDELEISKIADRLRDICHARDVALVIESHIMLVERLGLDGVHLTDGARAVRKTRDALGKEAIVGTFCGISKHDGMSASEAGADYVSFGPVQSTTLGDGQVADVDLFAWWSEMIEVPVVAEGALDIPTLANLRKVTDFVALQDEIWREDNQSEALSAYITAMTSTG